MSVPSAFEVGDNFAKCASRIGRARLPAGAVTAHEDAELFRAAMSELHGYATAGGVRAQHVLVHSVVSEGWRDGTMRALRDMLGIGRFSDLSSQLDVRVGCFRFIDTHAIRHAWNRHHHRPREASSFDVAPEAGDFHLIPAIGSPTNIAEFDFPCRPVKRIRNFQKRNASKQV